MSYLSVIIIGRNEARHIAKCIRSVLQGTESFAAREIVYVDSASEDETVSIAKQYPISILQLKPHWRLSAAAGRYVGYRNSSGKYLFFIDGDTVVEKGWLSEAIAYLEQHPQVAGIAGVLHEASVDSSGRVIALQRNRYRQDASQNPVQTLGGIALYRRAALEEAGPFNPYLKVDEERELALRLRAAGFALHRIDVPMAVTYAPPRDTIQEILRRSRSGLYDFGTTLRYCLANGTFWRYSAERLGFIYSFLLAVAAVFGIAAASLLFRRGWILWASTALVITLLVFLKRAAAPHVTIRLLKRCAVSYCTIRSFCGARANPIQSYPTDAIVVKP